MTSYDISEKITSNALKELISRRIVEKTDIKKVSKQFTLQTDFISEDEEKHYTSTSYDVNKLRETLGVQASAGISNKFKLTKCVFINGK